MSFRKKTRILSWLNTKKCNWQTTNVQINNFKPLYFTWVNFSMTMALLVQLKWASLLLASPNPFSIGFISGEFPGHFTLLIPLSCKNFLLRRLVWAGALSAWNKTNLSGHPKTNKDERTNKLVLTNQLDLVPLLKSFLPGGA